MKETNHDYGNCLVDNFYDNATTTSYKSWSEFKESWYGFTGPSSLNYDDTYHFLFRYDIHKNKRTNTFYLELCFMLQRKGIYSHVYVNNITQTELDTEIASWLKARKAYMLTLWAEV